jgi:1,4-dihydroxy-2-naphthoyl-CoA hydrolase
MTTHSADEWNTRGQGMLPGHLGVVIKTVADRLVEAHMAVRPELMAPNGFLHAGALVTLADTCAGYGCMHHLPEGAKGFTTIELKSNHLATTRDGTVLCVARAQHLGRTTQVWDATVSHLESGRTLVLFRCTQMVLYER